MTTTATGAAPEKEDALVDQLLRRAESKTFETKRLQGKNDKRIETVLAFANTVGGYLVLGLEDADKATGRDRVYGIENPEGIDELKRLVRQRFTPPLAPPDAPMPEFFPVRCTLRDGRDGQVVVVRVHASPVVHSLVNGGTFVRLERSNREISAAEITELSLRKGVVSFVAQTVELPLVLLDTPLFRGYAQARQLTRGFPESLEHVGLAKRAPDGSLRPTRAAVLLFADDPGGLLDEKCAVRIFQYVGDRIDYSQDTNLLRAPKTVRGPLIQQVRQATDAVVDALASGLRSGPLGFEVVQKYPLRVLREAITNAVLHRSYSRSGDIHIRMFDHRIEIESPGAFARGVTAANIRTIGSRPRNPQIVDHLREFPNPPNLDAGEGVRMMVDLMERSHLYAPLYQDRVAEGAESVQVVLYNQARPTVWAEVEQHLARQGTIGNAEVRRLLKTGDTLQASKQLKAWVDAGHLVVDDPAAAKQHRRYRLPRAEPFDLLLIHALGKTEPTSHET